MSSITPLYASAEMADGTIHNVRVMLKDKMQLEKTAKVRKWDQEKDATTTSVFMAWHALKREGLYTETFEKFLDGDCVDIFMSNDRPDDESLNPTQPGTTNDS